MVHQLIKFHVQRVDMVINPPWNLPFLGAKGLTSPEQTAIGVNTPGSDENRLKLYDLIADMKCCKEQGASSNSRKSNVIVPNILKDKVYNNFQKLKDEGTQRNLKITSEAQVKGGLLGIIVNKLKSGRVKSGRHS
ncbi:hypothetical protein Tco_1325313 [Tanacetum coccineum]